MPKKKTKKAVSKRFKVTKNGKVLFTHTGRGHLLSSKTRKRKRQLRAGGVLSEAEAPRIRQMLAS